MDQVEKKVLQHEYQIELFINTFSPLKKSKFKDGQIFDAETIAVENIKGAKEINCTY
jgi:hypothetical protein